MIAGYLQRRVSPSTLGLFRILFGLLLAWEAWTYYSSGRIGYYYVVVVTTFPYEWFPFVTPLQGNGMYWIFATWGVSALSMALGLFTRLSTSLLFLSYTYVFLLDKSNYNNHYYLTSLLLFLLIVVDTARWGSLDRLRRKDQPQTIPGWQLAILQFQWLIVYFYAGVAKLNPDWLAGEPVGSRLRRMGGFFATEQVNFLYAYGGMMFDLMVPFLLLWRTSRVPAMLACVAFHLTNATQLSIGIFPWLGISALVLFLDPGKTARLFKNPPSDEQAEPMRNLAKAFIAIYVAIQILVPLRHWLYPGDVAWNDRGHRFAWRMKLRSKKGTLKFYATNPEGKKFRVSLDNLLTSRQHTTMYTRPDMILQMARQLAQHPDWKLEVKSNIQLNSREAQPLIKPGIDIRKATWSLFQPADWIEPLQAPYAPVSPEFRHFRKSVGGALVGLASLLALRVFIGRIRLLSLLCLALSFGWAAGLCNSIPGLLGILVIGGLTAKKSNPQYPRTKGWFSLVILTLWFWLLTPLIAP